MEDKEDKIVEFLEEKPKLKDLIEAEQYWSVTKCGIW